VVFTAKYGQRRQKLTAHKNMQCSHCFTHKPQHVSSAPSLQTFRRRGCRFCSDVASRPILLFHTAVTWFFVQSQRLRNVRTSSAEQGPHTCAREFYYVKVAY